MFSKYTIVPWISTTKSLNIITWQQLQVEEKSEYVFPTIESIFQTKKDVIENSMDLMTNRKICVYDIHDGKRLYLLTQHSLFNH